MTPRLDCNEKKALFDQIKRWLIIPLVGGLVITLIKDWRSLVNGDYAFFIESTLLSFIFWSSLANGNAIIITFIDRYWSWIEHPIKRVVIGLISLLIYTSIASTIVIYCYVEWMLSFSFVAMVDHQGWFSILQIPLGITLVIAFWEHTKAFFLEWRQAAIDIERLKTENLKSKFEALKSQVNPHFLFNSLNALSSLVYANQDKAVEFIKKLSDVYRYVLDHQEDELVMVSKEVKFLKDFVFLNKIRFGDNLEMNCKNLELVDEQLSIPPLTLQMLVENCLKHNEISKAHRLSITVALISPKEMGDNNDNAYISVKNNINPMLDTKPRKSGLGLDNIKARYQILSAQPISISDDGQYFETKVPLLKLPS